MKQTIKQSLKFSIPVVIFLTVFISWLAGFKEGLVPGLIIGLSVGGLIALIVALVFSNLGKEVLTGLPRMKKHVYNRDQALRKFFRPYLYSFWARYLRVTQAKFTYFS